MSTRQHTRQGAILTVIMSILATLITLTLIKFPMIYEAPKQFPGENGCILDIHNIDERNFSIDYLLHMTKRRF
jgi:hypothetical protein